MRLTHIAELLGVTPTRARQIYLEAEEDVRRASFDKLPTQSRPIDMGGPRDVWLEFYPPPDPRFDNMAPVRLDNAQDVAA
jgi:hypothetical protein